MNKKLVLHTCCAPCFGHVYELLHLKYNIIPFFYNPNIAPKSEYKKRFEELKGFCAKIGVDVHHGEYDTKTWTSSVKKRRFAGERSERCWICYEFRLKKAFEFAAANNISIVATTLSISPHKDADKINAIGLSIARENGIEFLEADFKKNGGFQKSLEISKAHGFYRQNYCGCIYSKLERNKESLWYKKIKSSV